ncbi:MAG: hypothetical protein HYZ44_06400 [Bacteroidetes bacterium]|nr:hypothetical protein [Bacteroidota bacterium]
MKDQRVSFIQKLFPFLNKIEIACWLGLIIGFVAQYLNYPSQSLQVVSLIGLSIVFFLGAYQPSNIVQEEGEKWGMPELFQLMIVPKVLGIGMAVACLGIVFKIIDNNPKGSAQMLLLGGGTCAIAITIALVGVLTKVKHVQSVVPKLYRAVPIAAAALYLFSTI